MIIDSHIHISYIKEKKEFFEIKKNLLLNMKKNGVDRSIVIPDNLHGSNCADLENVLNLIKGENSLYAMGTLQIEEINPLNIEKIDNLFYQKLIKGFKIFPGHDPIYPTDQRLYPIYELCIKHDYPLIIHTGINSDSDRLCANYNDPKYIIEIAKKFSNLKIIIAHYFWPKLDYCFDLTNGFKNIYFDTSALADPEVIGMSGGIEKMKEILQKTFKRNPDSVLFGTDWPMCEVERHIDLIKSLEINEAEKEKIFCGNSIRLFKLK